VHPDRFPQLAALRSCFIRGSVVRYIALSKADVDTALLQDASRREAMKTGN
jgi:U6 snRNA-associated Sm-like protein LSm2